MDAQATTIDSPRTRAAHGNETSARIEVLRLVATTLLVAYHVIGSGPGSGLQIDYPHPLRLFANFFVDLRMPLFAFIAGFVYAIRPVAPDAFGNFVRGKVRRLLVPGAVAVTLFALVSLVTGTGFALPLGEFWQAYVYPYAHYWYLQTIFLIFMAYTLLEVVARRQLTWVILIGTIALYIDDYELPTTLFSANSVTYLAPFFALGVLWRREEALVERHMKLLLALAVVAVAAATVWNVALYLETGAFSSDRTDLQSLAFGFGAPILMMAIPAPARSLRSIGVFSFTVYLYHIFATAGMRDVLQALSVDDVAVLFTLGLAAGIGFPVLLHLVAMRWDVTRKLVLGLR